MYAGIILEVSAAQETFPTAASVQAGSAALVPRIDEARKEQLVPSEGCPPDLVALPRAVLRAP